MNAEDKLNPAEAAQAFLEIAASNAQTQKVGEVMARLQARFPHMPLHELQARIQYLSMGIELP